METSQFSDRTEWPLSEKLEMPMKEEEMVLDESVIKMLEVTMEKKETIQDKLPTKSKTIQRSKKSITIPSTKTFKKTKLKLPKTKRQTKKI